MLLTATALLAVGFLAASFWYSFAQKKNAATMALILKVVFGSDCLPCMGKNSYSCI